MEMASKGLCEYVDIKKVAASNLEERTKATLRPLVGSGTVQTPKDYSSWLSNYIVPQSAVSVNEQQQN